MLVLSRIGDDSSHRAEHGRGEQDTRTAENGGEEFPRELVAVSQFARRGDQARRVNSVGAILKGGEMNVSSDELLHPFRGGYEEERISSTGLPFKVWGYPQRTHDILKYRKGFGDYLRGVLDDGQFADEGEWERRDSQIPCES